MGAQDIVSRLQWVDEKLMRPFQELLKAMQEVAEVEAQFVGKQQALDQLAAQHQELQIKVNDKRGELQTLEREDAIRIGTKRRQFETDHAERMKAADTEYTSKVDAHATAIAALGRDHQTVKANLDTIQTEYAGAHRTLQIEHDKQVALRREAIEDLDRQITLLKTKRDNFLKEVGHVVA